MTVQPSRAFFPQGRKRAGAFRQERRPSRSVSPRSASGLGGSSRLWGPVGFTNMTDGIPLHLNSLFGRTDLLIFVIPTRGLGGQGSRRDGSGRGRRGSVTPGRA